jgi:ribonuclease T2
VRSITPGGKQFSHCTDPDIIAAQGINGCGYRYWISQGSPNGDFWGHEFSKHATCYSTFDLPCYGPQYRKHEEVIDFFETAVMYYQTLPTHRWLAEAAIQPCNATTVSLREVQVALTAGFGALPYVGCSGPRYNATAAGQGSQDDGMTVLSEVWYYHHVRGRVQSGRSVPVDASINGGSVSNCATTPGAVHYYERTLGSED